MKFKLVGIGEVVWDLFPSGRNLGGVPVSSVFHARALCAERPANSDYNWIAGALLKGY